MLACIHLRTIAYRLPRGGSDTAKALAVSPTGAVSVTGTTFSGDFPVVTPVLQKESGKSNFASSSDGGATWNVKSQGLSTASIGELVRDPSNSSVVYAVTFPGLFKSVDGGTT